MLKSCNAEPVKVFIAMHPEGYAVPSSVSHDRAEVIVNIFRMTGRDFDEATQDGWLIMQATLNDESA